MWFSAFCFHMFVAAMQPKSAEQREHSTVKHEKMRAMYGNAAWISPYKRTIYMQTNVRLGSYTYHQNAAIHFKSPDTGLCTLSRDSVSITNSSVPSNNQFLVGLQCERVAGDSALRLIGKMQLLDNRSFCK